MISDNRTTLVTDLEELRRILQVVDGRAAVSQPRPFFITQRVQTRWQVARLALVALSGGRRRDSRQRLAVSEPKSWQ
jgi:hypothetical protein